MTAKRVPVLFFRTESGSEPVRSWLKSMAPRDRRLIGEDIKTVEFGWPIGMPTCRSLGNGLYEVRTDLPGNRIARVFFYVDKDKRMVLLHGFLKKTRVTPAPELDLARANKRKHEKGIT
jgi:phage-related protein